METSILWFLAVIVSMSITSTASQTMHNKSSDEHNGPATEQRHGSDTANGNGDRSRNGEAVGEADQPHSRKKRLIWITDDGRLALPPGTALTITPTISLPLVRYPLEGFLSNMTMSFPLTIDFDKLGLTDNENPLGVLPPLFARSMGRAAGTYLADYIGDYLTSRKARSVSEENGDDFMTISSSRSAKLPDTHQHAFHGGERAILYGVAEDMLSTFGMDGKACLLRAICEIHSKKSLDHLGLIGEVAKLFFTVTKSNYAYLLTEYVDAQQVGEGKREPGECFPYYKKCPKSIFKGTFGGSIYSQTHSDDESNFNEVDGKLLKHDDDYSDAKIVYVHDDKNGPQRKFNM